MEREKALNEGGGEKGAQRGGAWICAVMKLKTCTQHKNVAATAVQKETGWRVVMRWLAAQREISCLRTTAG